MSVSPFLLALYRAWANKSRLQSSVSLFAQSTLFDANVLRLIHAYARPLCVVKIRDLNHRHNIPDFISDQVTLYVCLSQFIVVQETTSGRVLHEWQIENHANRRVKTLFYHEPKQQVMINMIGPGTHQQIIEFRTLQGHLLRQMEFDEAFEDHMNHITVDPRHHYIALWGRYGVQVLDWDDLSQPKFARKAHSAAEHIWGIDWDSDHHQLIINIFHYRFHVISMITHQQVEELSIRAYGGGIGFYAEHQCFCTQSSTHAQFWSKHERLETLTWDKDLGAVQWVFPGRRYLLLGGNSKCAIYKIV